MRKHHLHLCQVVLLAAFLVLLPLALIFLTYACVRLRDFRNDRSRRRRNDSHRIRNDAENQGKQSELQMILKSLLTLFYCLHALFVFLPT